MRIFISWRWNSSLKSSQIAGCCNVYLPGMSIVSACTHARACYKQACARTYTHTRTHARTNTCTYICIYVRYFLVCIRTFSLSYTHTYTHTSVLAFRVYVHARTYTKTHTTPHTHTHTHSHLVLPVSSRACEHKCSYVRTCTKIHTPRGPRKIGRSCGLCVAVCVAGVCVAVCVAGVCIARQGHLQHSPVRALSCH